MRPKFVAGLEVESRMDDVGKNGWASLVKGPVDLRLASPTYVPEGGRVGGRFPQSVYRFYVDDLEQLHARASSRRQRPADIE